MNYTSALNSIKTDFELSLNDLFGLLETLFDDNRKLKLKAFAPDKQTAKAFLEYLSWQDKTQKEKFEEIYAKESETINDWLKIYCEEYKCSNQDALLRIIEG